VNFAFKVVPFIEDSFLYLLGIMVRKTFTNLSCKSRAYRFGAIISQKRTLLGFSQEAFADAAVINRSYLGRIERGEYNFAMINLFKIAKALKIKRYIINTGSWLIALKLILRALRIKKLQSSKQEY